MDTKPRKPAPGSLTEAEREEYRAGAKERADEAAARGAAARVEAQAMAEAEAARLAAIVDAEEREAERERAERERALQAAPDPTPLVGPKDPTPPIAEVSTIVEATLPNGEVVRFDSVGMSANEIERRIAVLSQEATDEAV